MKVFPVLICAVLVLLVIPLASASSVDARARVLHVKDGLWQVTGKGNDVNVEEILGHIPRKSGSVILLALGDDSIGTGKSGELLERVSDGTSPILYLLLSISPNSSHDWTVYGAPPNSGHEWTVYGKGNDVNVEELQERDFDQIAVGTLNFKVEIGGATIGTFRDGKGNDVNLFVVDVNDPSKTDLNFLDLNGQGVWASLNHENIKSAGNFMISISDPEGDRIGILSLIQKMPDGRF